MRHSNILTWLLAALALASGISAAADTPSTERQTAIVLGDIEAEIRIVPAEGTYTLLWIAPGYGGREEHLVFGSGLAREGLETWMVDLVDALFLPRDRNAMLRVDPEAIADLVTLAHRRSGKGVVMIGTGDAAIPILRGARAWQARGEPQSELLGAVLLGPQLYRAVPRVGDEPEYLPIVEATRVPLAIFQPAARTGGQRLPALVDALSSAGSQVYSQLMPETAVLFIDEARTPSGRAAITRLPREIRRLLPLLEKTAYLAAPAPLPEDPVTDRPSLDLALRTIPDAPPAPPIRLTDVNGKSWRIEDYRGRVTVINFWATWCPPCVEEIPSLSRLQSAMQSTAFELVSIDFAETPEVIREFLERVHVDFPVLLDSDGSVGTAWKVIALPSTFVVDPAGRIRYGSNGALHWDSPEVIETLKALLDEAVD
jgi:peroxiredoxin